MLTRCYNKNRKSYADYGGRGITVCERWRTFSNFLEDMGERPLGTTIERKDNNGNYEPGNCLWIPRFEQYSNTRRTKRLTFNGVTAHLSEMCRRLGLNRRMVQYRLTHGWDVSKALSTPSRFHSKTLTIGLLIAALTVLPLQDTHAPEPPHPEVISCIMTWCAIGIFGACIVACYWHAWTSDYSGPTNSPPLVQIPTNSIPTNSPPLFGIDATRQTQHLDARPYSWRDSSGSPVTDLYRTTIQTSTSPTGPWSSAYVVTLWESAYGDTLLLEDGAGAALCTNYSRRAPNGSVTNFAPLALAHTDPQRFYRATP